MPKLNIYVPDEMKARMDAVEKSANWSAVAQRAFDLELKHLEAVKEIKDMSDVIERLRTSKARTVAEKAEEGREAGVNWAKHEAEYEELKRIAALDISGWPEVERTSGRATGKRDLRARRGSLVHGGKRRVAPAESVPG